MARPIWTGTLSFGLLNVPVSLMPGERGVDLHFRMLDARSKTPIRYERVNAETGEEVPWKSIVKAFEYQKGSYVVLQPEDLKAAASEGRETVEVEAFVDATSIGPEYYEKPYVLVPGKKAAKGYVLLREVLKRSGKIGIAKVVIRTREYLSAVMPKDDALLLILLRYPQELVAIDNYAIPSGDSADYRISAKELDMAEQLIQSMASPWQPQDYHDEFRGRLRKVIEQRMRAEDVVIDEDEGEAAPASTNVVDFMALLRQSLADKRRTPPAKVGKTAGKSAAKSTARKSSAKNTSASKTSTKKSPAKKAVKPSKLSTSGDKATAKSSRRRKAG